MKSIKYIFSILTLAIILSIASCSDPCDNVDCVNGECIEGICNCIEGYEGDDCGTAFNLKFLGDYIMEAESCTISGPGNVPYAITIGISQTASFDVFVFFIDGLGEDLGRRAIANIDSNGVDFSFSSPVFGFFGIDIDGEGSIDTSTNTIQISYTSYDPDTGEILDECTGTIKRA